VELPEPWSSQYESAVSPAEKSLIALLATAGVPVPVVGFETTAGFPIAVSWPDCRVAVDLDLDTEDRDELNEDGWTVVPPEVEAIQRQLAIGGGS
jgi:hypothetical protein